MKNTKTSLKILVMLGLALLSICIFNTNVYATELTQDYLKSLVEVLPSEMTIDLKEVEYEKADEIIKTKITEIWKEKDVDAQGVNINIRGNEDIYLGKEDFHTFTVYLYNTDGSIHYESESIKLSYNNTNSYNSADEKAVKAVKLPNAPKYFTFDIDKYNTLISKGKDSWDAVLEIISEYYQDNNSDTTLKFVASSGAGDSSPLYFNISDLTIGIFKNGVLYETRNIGDFSAICKIVIPQEVKETEADYINYATPLIKKSFNLDTAVVTKGAKLDDGTTIENGYKVNDYERIILEKAKVENISKKDTTTGIKLETTTVVVPEGTTLVAEKVTTGDNYNTVVKAVEKDVSKFVLYDISLMNNNAKIQPNGKVKVSIPVPEGYDTSKIIVYRVAEDGTKTKLDASVKDGYVVFETDHFSNYVVAEENTTTITDTNKPSEETVTEETTKEHIKDETPKTGENNIATIISSILSIVSIAGIAIVKKF